MQLKRWRVFELPKTAQTSQPRESYGVCNDSLICGTMFHDYNSIAAIATMPSLLYIWGLFLTNMV